MDACHDMSSFVFLIARISWFSDCAFLIARIARVSACAFLIARIARVSDYAFLIVRIARVQLELLQRSGQMVRIDWLDALTARKVEAVKQARSQVI